MLDFVSTRSTGTYNLQAQTNFNSAPQLTSHDSITADNHLVDKKYVTDAINAIPGVDLSGYYTKGEVDNQFTTVNKTKQDKLTAGDNITITNNIISATGSSDWFRYDCKCSNADDRKRSVRNSYFFHMCDTSLFKSCVISVFYLL